MQYVDVLSPEKQRCLTIFVTLGQKPIKSGANPIARAALEHTTTPIPLDTRYTQYVTAKCGYRFSTKRHSCFQLSHALQLIRAFGANKLKLPNHPGKQILGFSTKNTTSTSITNFVCTPKKNFTQGATRATLWRRRCYHNISTSRQK